MKRKQVYILLGAALVLAIAGTIFQMVRSSGWKGQDTDVEPFAKLPVDSIAKLVLKSSKETVTLQKGKDIWTVAERDGYAADFTKIRDLIRSIWEFKVVRQLEVGPSQFGRLNIVAPGQGDESGLQLDMIDAGGKPIKTLIFGKTLGGEDEQSEAAGASGRFVYDPSEKNKVYLSSETFYSLDVSPQNWIDKAFIKPEAIKAVTRGPSDGGDGWTIGRKDEKSDWQLVDAKPGEALNPEVIAGLDSLAPELTDVKPATTPDSETGLNKPVTVDLTTFDGFKYIIELGKTGPQETRFLRFKVSADLPATRTPDPKESADEKKQKDDEFAKHLEELKARLTAEEKLQNWVFEVTDVSVGALIKGRQDLLKPAPSPTPAAPKPVAPVPLTPTPAATVSPTAPLVSPSPEVSATPETSPSPEPSSSPEAVPSASPSPSATPES